MNLDGFTSRCISNVQNQNKQKEQKMSEKYLPKVGEIVILKRDPAILYRDTTPQDGTEMEVVAYFNGVPVCAWEDDFSCHSETFGTSSLRPLPLKSPKELAIEAMHMDCRIAGTKENGKLLSIYQVIYDAIAAGKIPGVVIEKKKRKIRVTFDNIYEGDKGEFKIKYFITIDGTIAVEDTIHGSFSAPYSKVYEVDINGGGIQFHHMHSSGARLTYKAEWVD